MNRKMRSTATAIAQLLVRRSVAVVAVVACLGVLAPTAVAHASAPTCGGRAVTIYDTDGEVHGTPGDDVILSGDRIDRIYGHQPRMGEFRPLWSPRTPRRLP